MMVRRPRPTKAKVSLAKASVLEDQFFASPKRKDCKVDEGNATKEGKDSSHSLKTTKSPSPSKNRLERGGISGRVIGVPLATRSQTRTIEKFFKAKAAAEHGAEPKTEANDQKPLGKMTTATIRATSNNNNSINHSQPAFPISLHASARFIHASAANDDNLASAPLLQGQRRLGTAAKFLPDFVCDLSEDTTDTDNTELSDEFSAASGGVASSQAAAMSSISSFADAHRLLMRGNAGSSSTRSSTTDNLFLQEPVLTLDVDKSPNQASSIKINKTLELEPVFSSPPSISASLLNGHFNKIVSLQCSPVKQQNYFGFEPVPLQQTDEVKKSFEFSSLDQDSSSCDSGVAFGSTTTTNTLQEASSPQPLQVAALEGAASRRRKPNTPHRILCPSPIKAAPRIVSPARGCTVAGTKASPSRRKLAAAEDQLSPRKSPRKQVATGSKARRKLHQQKEHPAPYHSTTAEQNGYKLDNQSDTEVVHIKNETEDQELENLQTATTKTILNSIPQPPQEKLKPTNKSAVNKTTTKDTGNKLKKQQPKMKLNQVSHAQPLAATNGNHELTEFFPVRRSVRKTKTAVKEEMMRNLEQAVLEERSEGLKVAHFENKGRGVVAERRFQRGEFVIEYVGDLITMAEAAEREKQYALDENAGCYMYYFKHKNQQYCIDATVDTGKLGRLVNHSRNGNLITKVVVVKQRPHLILMAKDDIEPGEELTYDYGDRSKESLMHHPWLAF